MLRYRDVTSAPVVLDLSEGHGEVHLSVYAPDKEVVLRSGKKVRCMLLQERDDGSVLVATGNTPRDHRHIPAEKIETRPRYRTAMSAHDEPSAWHTRESLLGAGPRPK